jgi:two-component system OmpR family sensor kinase
MRRPLFWKILIGFFLTITLITQGLWLLLALPSSPLEMRNDASDVEHFAIAIAAAAIKQGGMKALDQQTAHWPAELREGLVIDQDVRTLASPGGTSTFVTDPSGKEHQVGFRALAHSYVQRPKYIFLLVLGGLAFSAILAWYLTRPIWQIRIAFRKLSQGDFSVRLGPGLEKRRDEIADMASDFDTMAGQLQKLISSRDLLLATVSHELRSPLARLRLAVGLARQEDSEIEKSFLRIEEEVERLDHLVGELLTLSRIESSVAQSEDQFGLNPLLTAIIEDANYEAKPRGVEILFSESKNGCAANPVCAGKSRLIRSAIENVVRNAIRFSSRGQTVEIAVKLHETNKVEIRVSDEGPGMSSETLEKVFQPFYKAERRHDGFGLGLAIAQRVVTAHGGTLSVRNRSIKGLAVTIELPTVHDRTGTAIGYLTPASLANAT